jgi:hypothetical protein
MPGQNPAGSSATAEYPTLVSVSDGTNTQTMRTPTIFKSVTATAAGDTALWTPAAGKKFRLMRFKLHITADSTMAAAGRNVIKFRDGTTDMNISHTMWLGQVALTAITALFTPGYDTGWIDLGNGILSSTANNVLNVNLGTAMATGVVAVMVAGTEE